MHISIIIIACTQIVSQTRKGRRGKNACKRITTKLTIMPIINSELLYYSFLYPFAFFCFYVITSSVSILILLLIMHVIFVVRTILETE